MIDVDRTNALDEIAVLLRKALAICNQHKVPTNAIHHIDLGLYWVERVSSPDLV